MSDQQEWPEERMDIIGQNGPTGDHYPQPAGVPDGWSIKRHRHFNQPTISVSKQDELGNLMFGVLAIHGDSNMASDVLFHLASDLLGRNECIEHQNCPICGEGSLVERIETYDVITNCGKVSVSGFLCSYCPSCDSVTANGWQSRYNKLLGTLHTERHEHAQAMLATAQQPVQAEPQPAATMFHDAGAIAQCGNCGRYTLDRNALSQRDDKQPVCDCGQQHYWSGSFKKPDASAKWHGAAPKPAAGLTDERAAFEAWADDYPMRPTGWTEACWNAWQARAAIAAQKGQP